MVGDSRFARRFRDAIASGALALCCSGCAGPFGDGVLAYGHGRYPEALEQLRLAERDAVRWGAHDRTRYALYRGLTHLALGHRPAMLIWLSQAKRALDADPVLLSDEDAGRLASAWAHLSPE